ncbi:MAG: hypothetical protein EBZ98_03945 [Actinobacteria bacterium]|nr:hypothetical protein [Actinomycetota bacterium]
MAASIIWFRRDLRLADHPALTAALAHGVTTPLFVLDPIFTRVDRQRLEPAASGTQEHEPARCP